MPKAMGMNPAAAYGSQKPSLYENSPAAIKSAITNAKETTDRFLGIKKRSVAAHINRQTKEHTTGHQIAFPAKRNSRQRETIV